MHLHWVLIFWSSGLAITANKDILHAAEEFFEKLNKEGIDQFRVMTDF